MNSPPIAISRILLTFFVLIQLIWSAENIPSPPPATPHKTTNILTETSIYIPYKKLREVFEKEGRGVFLTYEQYRDLWEKARENFPPPAPDHPPVDATIAEMNANATVNGEAIQVMADLTIEVLKEGWVLIPLRLRDSAMQKATIDGQAATITFDKDLGYSLLLHREKGQASRFALALTFAQNYTKSPGRNQVSFSLPIAPLNHWRIIIPESGAAVQVEPAIAVSEIKNNETAKTTQVMAELGAASMVTLQWRPREEGAKGMTALVKVKSEQKVIVDEGVVRLSASLDYTISRAPLGTLKIELPASWKAVNVDALNIRAWTVEATANTQVITIQLYEPADKSQTLTLELEKHGVDAEFALPLISALDAAQQQGLIVIRAAPTLKIEPGKRVAITQMDRADLPADLSKKRWDYFYRYAAVPYELHFNSQPITPEVDVNSLVNLQVQSNDITISLQVVYTIVKAGLFRFDLVIPEGYEVRQVSGLGGIDVEPAAISGHHVRTDGARQILTVDLARKALGKVGLRVQLRRPFTLPEPGQSEAKPLPLTLEIPRVVPDGINRDEGKLILHGPESLRVIVKETAGLRTISMAEAMAGNPLIPESDVDKPVLAYAFGANEIRFQVEVQRRKPLITVQQLLSTRFDTALVTFNHTINLEVQFSAIDSLRLDMPRELDNRLRIATPGIRLSPVANAESVRDGYSAWYLTGDAPFIGKHQIQMSWETKLDQVEMGKAQPLNMPVLIPMNTDRAWGQIVLAKAENIEIEPTAYTGLLPIDPRYDLITGFTVPNGSRAFEFHGEWNLVVNLITYETKEVKATSIERGIVNMVVTRGGQVSVQAVYRLRSMRQRLVLKLPENITFDTQPLRLDGRPVNLEVGDNGQYLIPLSGQNPERAFLLELRYVMDDPGGQFQCPWFMDEPAVQQVYLSLFLPQDTAFLGSTGPWNHHLRWDHWRLRSIPRSSLSLDWLYNWVLIDQTIDPTHLRNFPCDGNHLLFSTLRPQPNPTSALRIRTMPVILLQAISIITILGLALGLMALAYPTRFAVAGSALTALFCLGVFLPSLFNALLNLTSGLALAVALAFWLFQLLKYLTAITPPVSSLKKRWQREDDDEQDYTSRNETESDNEPQSAKTETSHE